MAAETPFTGLVAYTEAIASGDILAAVNISVTTQSSLGSLQQITWGQLMTSPAITTPTITSPTVTGVLTVTGGTVIASVPALNITQTWNNGAVAFTAVRVNATNTASDATSLLLDLQVGGATQVKIDRTGLVTAQAINSAGINTLGSILFSGTGASIAAGKMHLNATDGLVISGKTGSSYDLVLLDNSGGISVAMPTGTKNITFGPAAVVDVVIGAAGGALATSANAGFLFLSSCAGTPSGSPAASTGAIPIVIDTSALKIWCKISGNWRFAALT